MREDDWFPTVGWPRASARAFVRALSEQVQDTQAQALLREAFEQETDWTKMGFCRILRRIMGWKAPTLLAVIKAVERDNREVIAGFERADDEEQAQCGTL
jgi:hypothetical protein